MKILIASPVNLNSKNQTGIKIRVDGVADYLKKNGHNIHLIDKYNKRKLDAFKNIYCLISTKKDSITYQITKSLKPNQKLIVDLYNPILLEKNLTHSRFNPKHILIRRTQISVIREILTKGTYFVVANRRQKNYWLRTSQSLKVPLSKEAIAIIPTGYPSNSIDHKGNKIIVWFGGIYPWLDPLPLLKAFMSISKHYPDWRLRIIGGYNPQSDFKKIFNNFKKEIERIPKERVEIVEWQNAQNLPNQLKDVSFAVHLPKESEEDIFAHRVRLLTLLNYQIPVLSSGKDQISKYIYLYQAGMNVSKEPKKLESSIKRLINNEQKIKRMSKNASKIQQVYINYEIFDPLFNNAR